MRCGNCGYVNRQGSRVCNLCGALMMDRKVSRKKKIINEFSRKPLIKVKRCVKCGHINTGNDIFCDQCGNELVAVEDTPAPQITSSIAATSERSLSSAVLTAILMTTGFVCGTLFGVLLL